MSKKKMFASVIAMFMAIFMAGTSINPVVFALENEDETQEIEETEKDDFPKDDDSDNSKNKEENSLFEDKDVKGENDDPTLSDDKNEIVNKDDPEQEEDLDKKGFAQTNKKTLVKGGTGNEDDNDVTSYSARWFDYSPTMSWDMGSWEDGIRKYRVTIRRWTSESSEPSATAVIEKEYSNSTNDYETFIASDLDAQYDAEVEYLDENNTTIGRAVSDKASFNAITLKLETYAEDGTTPIEVATPPIWLMFGVGEDSSQSHVDWDSSKSVTVYKMAGTACLEITSVELPFEFVKYTANGTDYTNKITSFDFTGDTTITAICKQNFARFPIHLEVGTGHDEVAAIITGKLNTADPNCDATVSGTTITFSVSVLNTVKDIIDEVNDVIDTSVITDKDEKFGNEIGLKESYESELEYYNDIQNHRNDAITTGQSFYMLWYKPLKEINFTLEAPICGTEVTLDSEYPFPSITPTFTADTSAIAKGYWMNDKTMASGFFCGKFIGGEGYWAYAIFDAMNFHYISDTITKVNVNGTSVAYEFFPAGEYYFFFNIEAEHDWSEETKVIDSEPTITSEGAYKLFCKTFNTCGGTTYEAIPAVTYSFSNGTSTWIKGSNITADFRFTRSFENPDTRHTAFAMLTEVRVDNTKTTEYKAEPGSVIVKLKPSYLETLSTGKHEVKALFSDGGTATASFTIAKKPSDDSSKKTTPKTDNVVTCQMAGFPANYAWNEAAKACQPGYIDDNGVFHSYANQYWKATRKASPNTQDDRDSWTFSLMMMLSLVLASYAGVKLVHEDWEV